MGGVSVDGGECIWEGVFMGGVSVDGGVYGRVSGWKGEWMKEVTRVRKRL